MFEDTSVGSHRVKRCLEATAILAAFVTPSSLDEPGQSAPARAGRVCDYGERSRVETGIAGFVPRINTFKPIVGAVCLHEKSRHGHAVSLRTIKWVDNLFLSLYVRRDGHSETGKG